MGRNFWTRTGRLLIPLTKLLRTRRTSPASSTEARRGSRVSNISRISSRARLLPRQKCGLPLPKVTWSLGYLVTSKSYGESNTSGSRLPAANHMTTLSPARTVLPCSSTSRVAVRRKWYTGLAQRRNSSTAPGISDGSSRSRRSWSWCSMRASMEWLMACLVVSLPATTSSRK